MTNTQQYTINALTNKMAGNVSTLNSTQPGFVNNLLGLQPPPNQFIPPPITQPIYQQPIQQPVYQQPIQQPVY